MHPKRFDGQGPQGTGYVGALQRIQPPGGEPGGLGGYPFFLDDRGLDAGLGEIISNGAAGGPTADDDHIGITSHASLLKVTWNSWVIP